MKLLRRIFRIFRGTPKSYLLDNTYRIVPAFSSEGVDYYMHEDPTNTTLGRGLTAMVYMEEILMRCSADYLKAHTQAVDEILSNPAKINLPMIMKLNNNLKERVMLLSAIPDHVYKLASVVYFTKDESPYKYDHAFGKKKMKQWAESNLYDFFSQGHLKTLMPALALPESDSLKYSELVEKINHIHLQDLRSILSEKVLMADIKN